MSSSALALMQLGPRQAEIEEIPIPALEPGSALVEVEANGLCASDIDAYEGTDVVAKLRLGDRRLPRIPGHEIVGKIIDVGSRTLARADLEIGQRVAVNPFIACGRCEYCRIGRATLCRGWDIHPVYGYIPAWYEHGLWGGYSTHVYIHPNATLYPFPPEKSALDATQWNPLAAGVQWAVMNGRVTVGSSVVILGSGQRGLACVVAAKAAGASLIVSTGLTADRHKLQLAREFGADIVVDVQRDSVVEQVMTLTGGRGIDVVVDTTPGATQPIRDAVQMLRRGGRLVTAGIKGAPMADFPLDQITLKSIELVGSSGMDAEAYAVAASMIATTELPLPRMRTHVFGVRELERAIDVLAGRTDEHAINVVITPDDLTDQRG